MQLPQNAPFGVPVTLGLRGEPVTQASSLYPSDAVLQGTLTGPGLGAPMPLSGTLASGLSVPGLPQAGDYAISGVQLIRGTQIILGAKQATYTVTCLGEILLTSVSSSPMTLKEIKEAGIQLQPGDYVGRRFEMTLSVGSQQISLNVPVVIPVYNGLEDPRSSGGGDAGLQIGNINGAIPPGLSVVLADIVPEKDPFTLSRPSLSFQMRHNFKALLVIPGSIGFLKQVYKVNVVVLNALAAGSPYKISHLSAKWLPPAGLDGQVGTQDDPLHPTVGEDLIQPLVGADGTSVIAAGQSAMAAFTTIGNAEGSHALDFHIAGQFEGGDLSQPVAITGTAHGKVLVQNPNFNLMLVHPDVVRRGHSYTLEAHLTNTSQALANAVSLTIDKARLAGAQLIGDATQRVDTLLPGQTVVMKFQLQAFISGQVTSSYLYIDPGNNIGFQLSTGIGPRQVALNPDTLALPDSLVDPQSGISKSLQEAMLALLNAAYDVATSQKALPSGVLPISRGTITTTMAQNLSQEGLFLGMGLDKARVWWDLWRLFTQNSDAGFDQLMRTTQVGADLRNALLADGPWAQNQQGPADRAKDFATFNAGLGNSALVGIHGAGPGLIISMVDGNNRFLQARVPVSGPAPLPMPSLGAKGAAWGAWGGLQILQFPMGQTDTVQMVLTNQGPDAQALTLGIVNPVAGQGAPSANTLSLALDQGVSATLSLGPTRQLVARLTSAKGDILANVAASFTENAPAEPFQVLGVHRYDLGVSGSANPYGTQVMVLFNRPNMPLAIPDGDAGFQAASALIQVEANQFWRKVMAQNPETGVVPSSPAALLQAYPRVVSCYLEKPVGPYVQRSLALSPAWTDASGNPIQGSLQWPIQSGLLPGGAIVKGHFRRLDGTGVPGRLTYWYQQAVNNAAVDLATGYSFADEEINLYYPLITNNVATEADGSYQLDYVPAPVGDYIGPFVLQGGFPGGTAFSQASVLGNGGMVQMDLVLEGRGSVDGYVLDAQDQPIGEAQVEAIQEQRSSDFTQGTGGGRFSVGGTTDAAGHYHLDGLKTGIFSLQVLKGELGAVSGGQITTDGQVVDLNVLLQGKVGTIKTRVLDAQGHLRMDQAVRLGIPGGLVRGASSSTTYVYPVEAKPGPDGWATFTRIPAGDVKLIAPYSAPTIANDWQGFLNPDQTLQVELKMVDPSQLASVQTLVVDAAGQPVSGAYLKFDNIPFTMNFVAQTGVDGTSSSVPVVPGGTLTGYVYHPNWVGLTATNSVVPQPGGSYLLKAVLPARCVLTGRVTRPDGSPVAGAYVAVPPVYDDNNKNRLGITDAHGLYTIPNLPAGASYRLAVVGPDLRTSVNVQVPVAVTDTSLAVNLTLPSVGRNTLSGTVYQPLSGNNQRIPTNATVQVYGQLPDIAPGDSGNAHWGLLQTVLVGGVGEDDMPPTRIGQFSIPNLPAGPYQASASSSLFPSLVTMTGDFGADTAGTKALDVYLKDSNVGLVQGKVVLADGQTPVAPGARVMVMTGGQSLLQVLSQPGGTYAFPKVIPAGRYALRVEDPQTGNIAVQPFELKSQEVKFLNLRLWGTGDLTVNVQDSKGNPMACVGAVTCGTVSLQHSKSGLAGPADMPLLALPLTPADKGTLVFPHLLEGPITVQLKDPSGLSGVASAEIPVGGGNQTVTVRLQPVGRIQGTLLRADGNPVAAGRVDAYQGGRWLGTCPTFVQFPSDPGPVPGHFMFDPLPTGAIRLEAWDPDSRQTGQATVDVKADQIAALTLTTLDTGKVTIQVLQEGQPVVRAGIDVAYQGGPALNFSTQATADENGLATFILPPGTYAVQATDPISLASGTLSFTRGLNAPAMSETLPVQPVRSVFVRALPPTVAQGQIPSSLAGWRVGASGLVNRTILLDANGQGTLQEMPVGTYTLGLTDAQGRPRGSQPFQVTAEGGALQMAQIQSRALGTLKVTVLDADGAPVSGVSTQPRGSWLGGTSLFTDAAGQAVFYGITQGTGSISASSANQAAQGAFTLNTEGEQALATISFAPTAALHGVVRDPFGQPVPYVAVSCRVVPDTATDGNGVYAFHGLPIGPTLTVTATTAQGRNGVSVPLTLSQGDDPEVDIALPAMGTLKGQVTDPLRATLPSLGIQVLNGAGQLLATSSTDQTGAFRFTTLPAGQGLLLKVFWEDGGTEATEKTFSVPGEGQTTTLAVTLPPFVDVTGWTLDASGSNQSMYVQLQDGQGRVLSTATTTVDIPTFFFRHLKAGLPFQLKGFQIDTHAAVALTVFTPTGQELTENHALQVSARPSLRLQLRYPDGSAAPGGSATAQIQGTGGLTSGLNWMVAFDASGTATLPSIPPGQVHIQVNGLPWQGPLGADVTLPAQAGVVPVDLPILGIGGLDLQLRYPDGSPAPGSGVRAQVSNLGEGGTHSVAGSFDGNGHLQWIWLPLGSARITVAGLPWQGPVELTVPLATQGQTLAQEVSVLGVGSLKIRLHTTLLPGHDVTQAVVSYVRNGQSRPMTLQPDGSFQADAPAGEPLPVQVTNYVVGKAFSQTFGALTQNGTTVTDLFGVPALGQIHGRVLGADGQPRAGVPVVLMDSGRLLQSISSDATGAYVMSAVEVGNTISLVAQDPLITPVTASLALSQEGQDLQQDFHLKGFATLTVHVARTDGSDNPGIQVTMAGQGVSLQGTTDAMGKATFLQVIPDVALTVTAHPASGVVSAQMTLHSLQSATVELKESPRTHLSGRVRRQRAGQTWPVGTTVQVYGATLATLALHPDGTFQDQDLTLGFATTLQLTVSMPGLSLPLPGTVTAQIGGETVIDQMAPGFGSLQAKVTLAGQPVSAADVRFDNAAYSTDAEGSTSSVNMLIGTHRLQVTTKDGMAWMDVPIQTDGQSQVVPLALQNNAAPLPASLTLERLGLAAHLPNDSWIPTLGLGLDLAPGALPAALTTPPQGYWVIPGRSLAWEQDQGDVHVTRILSSTGYGLREQLVFQNRGTMAHALSLSASTGTLHGGQDPQLGMASQTGGAWFNRCTVAWGKGAWVPTSLTASTYYSGSDTLRWPALTLQPGQTYSIWMGLVPHGQNVGIASDGTAQKRVPDAPESVARALQRMTGQAPEWIQDLDSRISNNDPAPTVTDPLPAWDGSASLDLIDPMGQAVQALGTPTLTLTVTPKEALAPQIVADWGPASRTFSVAFLQVPPDGLSYALSTSTPIQGEVAWGQSLDLKLSQDWAVAQFAVASNQAGNHVVSFGDGQTWSTSDTLQADTGLRWTTQAANLAWSAREQDNQNLKASGTTGLAPGVLTPIQIQFPAYGSVVVQGPASLGTQSYYSPRQLTAASTDASVGSQAWANGAFVFPALPAGAVQIKGTWDLGSVQVQEGATTTLTVPTGSLLVTGLDVNGVKLAGTVTVVLTQGGATNAFGNYGNPQAITDLPTGEYTVGLKDPASGAVVSTVATVSAGATTPVTLQLGQNGSLSVTLLSAAGTPHSGIWMTATPSNGGPQRAYTDANGFVHFVNLGTGTAGLTYGHVPGADPSDEPGSAPSLVTLVPGSDLPATVTVPNLGSVMVSGVTQAGDALPNGSYSIPKAFAPGRRTGYNAFQGIRLGQPLVVRFGDGGSYAPVDAPAITPTANGQSFALTFPLGRLRVRLLHQDQSPLPNVQVVLSIPGATYPQYAATDATGIATFTCVPMGARVACNATSGGAVVAASNVAFTGPDQLVELIFPATAQLTVHLHRVNSSAPLNANGWSWGLAPGTDGGAALPINILDAVFPGLYQGSSQTVTAVQYLNDNLLNSSVGAWNNYNATWTASLIQNMGQAATEATLILPVRASAALVFQDAQGHAFTGNTADTLTVTVKQSANPALMGTGNWHTPASCTFSSLDHTTLPEVFTEGIHVLSLRSAFWGDLPDVTFTVGPQDDGKQIQVPVVLDWLKTSSALRAVAGDGQTPVLGASFQLKANGWSLGTLAPSSPDGVLAVTDTVQEVLYVPRGRQVQFSATYAAPWYNGDGTSQWIDTGWVDGATHAAGDTFGEAITLPLTAARVRLTDTDGSDLGAFAAEAVADQVLPMARIQGATYATVLGLDPGPLNLTLYDPASGLGLSAVLDVLPVGQAATLVKALPAYAWLSQVTLQDTSLKVVAGPFWVGAGADSPGLVKPGLAQWFYDSSQGAPWQTFAGPGYGSQVLFASGSSLSVSGFQPLGDSPQGTPSLKVRVPLQGVIWIGNQIVDPGTGNIQPGPFAFQAYSLNPGDVLAPALQEPLRTWADVPLLIQDGSGNPYSTALILTPVHAPIGWGYTGSPDGSQSQSDGSGKALLNLPLGERLRVETAPPGSCGTYWYGFLDLTVPTPVPTDPYVLKADSQKVKSCPQF